MSALLKKPRKWAFNLGLVAPEWEWFWNSAEVMVISWGSTPIDLVRQRIGTLNGNPEKKALLGIGDSFYMDADADNVEFNHSIVPGDKFTFFNVFNFDKNSVSPNDVHRLHGMSSGIRAFIALTYNNEDDASPNLMTAVSQVIGGASSTTRTLFNNILKDRPYAQAVSIHGGGTGSLYTGILQDMLTGEIKEVPASTTLGTVPGAGDGLMQLGAERAIPTFGFAGGIAVGGVLRGTFPNELLKRLVCDPFGPFRMDDEVGVVLTVSVGDVSFLPRPRGMRHMLVR